MWDRSFYFHRPKNKDLLLIALETLVLISIRYHIYYNSNKTSSSWFMYQLKRFGVIILIMIFLSGNIRFSSFVGCIKDNLCNIWINSNYRSNFVWSILEYRFDSKICVYQYIDRKSTRLNSSHIPLSRMPS